MDDEILALVRERGEVAFSEVNAAFDADTGAVFRACRRLARSGDIHAVLPLVYRPGGGPASEEHARESANADGASTDEKPVTDDAGDADDDADDGGFEWVGGE